MQLNKKHVFIIGSKGIPANYGGFETFVDKLTKNSKNRNIVYHVACAIDEKDKSKVEFTFNDAYCFNIKWRKVGAARAIFYDLDALNWAIKYVKKNNIKEPIFYILACRIGPFISYYKKKINLLGGKLYVNPDGHEWKRAKWSRPIRRYWKISERLMVKKADLLICDSKNIEIYIKKCYQKYNPKTTFIAYGADLCKAKLLDNDDKIIDWYEKHNLSKKEYYLVVGRFVPENNFETMILEFIKSNTNKSLAIVTNVNQKFLEQLNKKTHFELDKRIKFVGTVYDQGLLKKIRENAYGYIHGHEVGGTNPSLLEALSSTDLNLLLEVGFNKEVAEDGALYWDKIEGDLANLILKADRLSNQEISDIGIKAKNRILRFYNWEYIVDKYERLLGE